MKVSELGEFGLIDLLAKMAGESRNQQPAPRQKLLIGIGDDAAAWRGDASTQLATVDSFVQDVHFSLDNTSWQDLGWKALAINISDIAAMGGVPRYALVALALPGHSEVANVTTLYQGMIELARQFEVTIIGGNITSAPLLAVTITVLGSAPDRGKHILTRSAARPGEKIAVTGHLGAAAAGAEMLARQLKFDSAATAALKRAFQRPPPRIAEGQLLATQGVKTAIDISDGLISDLSHICQASQVSARIEVGRVPVAPVARDKFGDRALDMALSGGEDYELLFTARAEVIDKVSAAASCAVTVVGEITDDKAGEVTAVDSRGQPLNLTRTGWEHFATE